MLCKLEGIEPDPSECMGKALQLKCSLSLDACFAPVKSGNLCRTAELLLRLPPEIGSIGSRAGGDLGGSGHRAMR